MTMEVQKMMLGRRCTDQDSSKNQTPQDFIKNLKSRTPKRPKLDFESILNHVLASVYDKTVDFLKQAKSIILL